MPTRTIRAGKFFAKLRDKSILVFDRRRSWIHLTVFFGLYKDFFTPHVSDDRHKGRARKLWEAKLAPEGLVTALKAIEAEVISHWVDASEPVGLGDLEDQGWLVMTMPSGARDWFSREFTATTVDLPKLRERYYLEVLGCPPPEHLPESEAVEALLVAFVRDAVRPTELDLAVVEPMVKCASGELYGMFRINPSTSAFERLWLSSCREEGTVAWFTRPTNWLPQERLLDITMRHTGPKPWEAMLKVADLFGLTVDRPKALSVIEMARARSKNLEGDG